MTDNLIAEFSQALESADWVAVLAALGVLLLGFFIASALSRVCDHQLRRFFPRSSPAGRALLNRVTRLTVVTLSVLVALQLLGISITSLIAAGTVVFVGLGLAVQKILQSLVAGTLLLLEREIEPGDVIRYEGQEYRVISIGLRTTQMESRFSETLILPNFLLATSPVMNLTHQGEPAVVLKLEVQVAYGSDSDLVERALLRAADSLEGRTEAPAQALLLTFGDSGINWLLRVPIDDPWRLPLRTSQLGRQVLREFDREGIAIPFPQLDVRIKESVSAGN